MSAARLARTLLAAACLLLALPALASAATYTVDSVGDEADENPGAGGCKTAVNSCTLRAAIEESNASAGVRDAIEFGAPFEGDLSDTVAPATELPPLTDPVTIDGSSGDNDCAEFGQACAGIDGPDDGAALRVEADEVTIENLSLTGAETGIAVLASSDDFVATGNGIGSDLNGASAGNATGILLGPGANDAEIGTYSGGNRIVYSSGVGLDLEGASRARIRSNSFGLDGQTAAPNGTNIEITDYAGDSPIKAVDNEVGSELFRFGELSEYCDEGCNLIAGAVEDGIDLQGDGGSELPASGPTVIRSNFFGSDFSGEVALPNGHAAIAVGKSDRVTIGGSREKDGNLINGGQWGVLAGPSSQELRIERNVVGREAGEPWQLDPPSSGAFSIDSGDLFGDEARARIVGNTISIVDGTAIANDGDAAQIAGNRIYGGDLGIHVAGGNAAWYGAITGNELELPGEFGILIESSKQRVFGNHIFGAEQAGIGLDSSVHWVREVELGGDEASEENEIEWGGGPAISLVDGNTAFVLIKHNRGVKNAGPFIDLGADGLGNEPTGPNGGIQAPVVETSRESSVAGSAQPGAFVQVFEKSESAPGDLGRFLASDVASESGQWSADIPVPIAAGTLVAATQNAYEGTSELSSALVTEPDPEFKVVCSPLKAPMNPGFCEPVPCPPMLPECGVLSEATITAGPKPKSAKTTARFTFTASVAGSTFICRIDNKQFRKCGSPRVYRNLSPGKHVFYVRAVDDDGIAGPIAKRVFRVMRPGR